jgi:hypothetical protein
MRKGIKMPNYPNDFRVSPFLLQPRNIILTFRSSFLAGSLPTAVLEMIKTSCQSLRMKTNLKRPPLLVGFMIKRIKHFGREA